MNTVPVMFYLNQRYVGEAELPAFTGGTRWFFGFQSHHYIDPIDGRVWGSVEFPGQEWGTWLIPAVDQRHASVRHRSRGFKLDWFFGSNFYNDPAHLVLLPRPILEHEYLAAEYNHANTAF